MDSVIQAIESWPLAVMLRKSIWIYPLINAAHILGIAMLVGAIGTLDLRLIGLWRRQPAAVLVSVLVPVAVCGFALAATTGILLFIARAADYAGHWLFQVKLGLIALGLLNIWLLRRHADWPRVVADGLVTKRIKIAALLSITVWLSVLLSGRLLGYR